MALNETLNNLPKVSFAGYIWERRKLCTRLLLPLPNKLTKEISRRHYDDSVWKSVQEEFEKMGHSINEDAVLFSDEGKKQRLMLYEGQIYRLSAKEFWKIWKEVLVRELRPFISKDTTIVEFGCGYGRNLFSLKKEFPENSFFGGDLSRTGMSVANDLVRRLGHSAMVFETIDMADLKDLREKLSFLETKDFIVYTSHSLEQAKYETRKILENILSLNPRVIVHFEPVIEHHTGGFLTRDFFVRRYLKVYDYLDSLLTNLEDLQAKGKIEITHQKKLQFGRPVNDRSLIAWKPKGSLPCSNNQ